MAGLCKWSARIFCWFINLLSLAILVAFVGGYLLSQQDGRWGYAFLMPDFWAVVALYALYPVLFCLGLSLIKVGNASRLAFLIFGVPALLPWVVGMSFLIVQAPVIGTRMVAHAERMQKIMPQLQQLQRTAPEIKPAP